jgi:hypothetical protein
VSDHVSNGWGKCSIALVATWNSLCGLESDRVNTISGYVTSETMGGQLNFNYRPNDVWLVRQDVEEIRDKRVMIYSDGNIVSVKEVDCWPGVVPGFELIVEHRVNVSFQHKFQMNGAITDSKIQNNDEILKAKYLLNNNHIWIPEGTNIKKGD